MKKFLRYFLLAVLVAIICFMAFVGRKVVILAKLDDSVSNLQETKNNFYMKTISTGNPYNESESELFVKDTVEKMVVTRTIPETRKMIQIIYPTERKLYVESGEEKVYTVFNEVLQGEIKYIINFADSYSFMNRFFNALVSSIKSVEIDGKECYEISSMHSPNFIYSENSVGMSAYVEKDTGLPVRLLETIEENGTTKEYIIDYEVKFDCVTDEDIAEPDVSQYTLNENI